MNPYFDRISRPTAQPIDYVELHPSYAIPNDHNLLSAPTWSGPSRTPRKSRRSSPYPSPHSDASRSPSIASSPLHSDTESSASSRSERDLDNTSSDSDSNSNTPAFRGTKNVGAMGFAYDSDEEDSLSPPTPIPASKSRHAVPKATIANALDTGAAAPASKAASQPTTPGNKEVRFDGPEPRRITSVLTAADADEDLIAKPPGEVGRPNRGGYNLCDALGWPKHEYKTVMKFINQAVEDHLVGDLPLRKQSMSAVQKVRNLTIKKYPILEEYKDLWVIDDFIRCHLKVRKAALRTEKLEKIVADLEKEKEKGFEKDKPRESERILVSCQSSVECLKPIDAPYRPPFAFPPLRE
ncbi:hypothetical protein FB446DRAFT_709137 [Lentinula raphanica]|nr:hypothetical protein FB446DRAFT_709137 [Lentinula raphanica]